MHEVGLGVVGFVFEQEAISVLKNVQSEEHTNK